MLRPLGFAAAPGILVVLAPFPVVTGWVFAASAVWMLAAMVLAVRQTLDFSTIRHAVMVCVLGCYRRGYLDHPWSDVHPAGLLMNTSLSA